MTARSLFSVLRWVMISRSRSRLSALIRASRVDGVEIGRQWACSWRSVSARTNASKASDFFVASR